jgi:hypothetical protein
MADVKPVPVERIENAILVLRGHKVMLDTDLAALYGVSTKRFNEQVRRNHSRFPVDFMFQLTGEEWDALRSQFATLNAGRGRHRKYLPYAFTEHGAIMAATILNSPRATEISVYIDRAFVRLRETLATHKALASKLETLEKQTAALAFKHDALASNTRAQFKQVMDTLRELMAQPEPPPEPKRRPIGFVYPKEK